MTPLRPAKIIPLLLTLLVACSQQKIDTDLSDLLPAMLSAKKPEVWQLEGRIGVISADDSWTASVAWRHDRIRDVIEIAGPFGQGGFVVTMLPDSIVVLDGDKSVELRGQPEQAIEQRFGVKFPVSSLKFWLLGAARPDSVVVYNTQGFKQQGWLVQYRNISLLDDTLLPYKTNLENNTYKLKFVIDKWTIM